MTLAALLRRLAARIDDTGDDPADIDIPASMDRALDLLSVDRRRWLVREVADRDDGGGIPIGHLATDRAAIEQETDPDLVSSDARKRVYVGFYQTHIPKLDDAGLLDNQDGLVFATDATADAAAAVDVFERMVDPAAAESSPPAPDDLVPEGDDGDEPALVTDGGVTEKDLLEATETFFDGEGDIERVEYSPEQDAGVVVANVEEVDAGFCASETFDLLEFEETLNDYGFEHTGFIAVPEMTQVNVESTTEGDGEVATDGGSTTLADLEALVDDHERIDWTAVPGIGVKEAATWSARLQQAADELDDQPLVTDGGQDQVDYDAVAYVWNSHYRVDVLQALADGPAAPSVLAEQAGISIAHASRAVRELHDTGLVELLVDEDRQKGRIYGLTDAGESVVDEVDTVSAHVRPLSITIRDDERQAVVRDAIAAVQADLGQSVGLARAVEELARAYTADDQAVADGGDGA